MDASPASSVSPVNAVTRRGPHHRVNAANAGGYRVATIAAPANNQPATNTGNDPVTAITTTAGTASTEPAVITRRGPIRSNHCPTGTPTSADTTRPAENAPVTAGTDQPVSAAIAGARTGNA